VMDVVSREKRSAMMAGIKSKDTHPEMAVRRAAHRLGLRFRLHRRDLPGSPDLVFPGRRTALFVHGCYWHRHNGCKYAYTPKSNIEFWLQKLQTNVERDVRVRQDLAARGWNVVIIWECQTRAAGQLRAILAQEVCNVPR
jgi:DNA mismatch endonuclease (patch repair protein)